MIFYIAIDADGQRQLRGTQADAKAVNRSFEQIDIPTDKAGLMAFVQNLYNELSGVKSADAPAPYEDAPPSARQDVPRSSEESAQPCCNTHWSVRLDEEFNNLPLAHQLHFAAVAMENARNLVTPSNVAEQETATG